MFKNLSLSLKLILGFGTLLVLLISLAFFSYHSLEKLASQTSKLYKHPYAVSVSIRDINYHIVYIHRAMKDIALAKNDGAINKQIEIVKIAEQKALDSFNILEERFLGDKNRILEAKNNFIKWKPIRDEVINAMRAGEKEKAALITKDKGAKHVGKLIKSIDFILEFANKKGEGFYKNSQKEEKSIISQIIILSVITIIFTLLISFGLIRNIKSLMSNFQNGLLGFFSYLNRENKDVILLDDSSKDEFGQMSKVVNENINKTKIGIEEDRKLIDEAVVVLGEYEQGDLRQRLNLSVSNPALMELKEVVNKMASKLESNFDNILKILNEYSNYNYMHKIEQDGLKEYLLKLTSGVNNLGDSITYMLTDNKKIGLNLDNSSALLLSNVDTLNKNSNETAAALEETAAALEEITSTIRDNSLNVQKMSENAEDLTISATQGEKLAQETTSAMDEINEQVNSINEAIAVIDQIAFQTNILSLNAAVEAATAGEAGKGFAVVAQEVRNLASRSAEAAKEIKTIVELATTKASEGKVISQKMIEGYSSLSANIENTTNIIKNVDHASKEQANGIEQINDAVTQLDQQTQENVAVSNTTNEIAIETDKIAKEIVEEVDKKEFRNKNNIIVEKMEIKESTNYNSAKKETIIKEEKKSSSSDDSWESF